MAAPADPAAARGTLHLVPVPLVDASTAAPLPGSALGVLAPASLAVVRAARYFLVENARSARAFLKAVGHPDPIASLDIVQIGHEPDAALIDQWLAPLTLAPPVDAVVLSEAGCPGIADPGTSLAARAHECGIPVVPWPGPSSLVLALMGAGMNGQQFRFLGYLPQDREDLRQRLLALQPDAQRGETQVFIETPYRNARLFEIILQVCDPALRLCLAIDLTGAHAVLRTHTVGQWSRMAPAQWPALDRRPAVFLLHGQPGGRASPHR